MKLYRLPYRTNSNNGYGLLFNKKRMWYEVCHNYENKWDWGYIKGLLNELEPI